MISRDTDSRLSLREKAAVDEWLSSDKGFHIMRDHPWHKYPVLGGMWGIKGGVLPRMKQLIDQFAQEDRYGTDYEFFSQGVMPLVNGNIMIHDEFFDKKPFPTPRQGYEFVGEVFDENENSVVNHTQALKEHLKQRITSLIPGQRYVSKTIAIQHHMGLGDHICLNGLVRYVLSDLEFENVILFCKHPYEDMVKQMYSDEPRINVVSVGKVNSHHEETAFVLKYINERDRPCVYLRLGFELYEQVKPNFSDYSCDKCFYMMANVPYEVRWSHFNFNRIESEQERVYKRFNPADVPYIFVHDDPARGYEIKLNKKEIGNKLIIRNNTSESIMDYAGILEQAEEIHCIESSFRCFLEGLTPKATKLVFYDSIRESPGKLGTKFDWEFM
jgi:hypothetical protein